MAKPVYQLTGRRRQKRLLLKPWRTVEQLEIYVNGRTFWYSLRDISYLYGFWKDSEGFWITRPE